MSLTWKRGSKEPIPIRSSSLGREGPAVAGGHVAAVDPDLHLLAGAAGVDLEPAGERRVGRLVAVAVGEDAPPPERVDDEAGGEDAAVGLDRDLAIRSGGARRGR